MFKSVNNGGLLIMQARSYRIANAALAFPKNSRLTLLALALLAVLSGCWVDSFAESLWRLRCTGCYDDYAAQVVMGMLSILEWSLECGSLW